jgi:hypothetical protein
VRFLFGRDNVASDMRLAGSYLDDITITAR